MQTRKNAQGHNRKKYFEYKKQDEEIVLSSQAYNNKNNS